TVWIVFNGEIYNYVELREALVARGHRFKTNSDTEVVVHLYEDLGRSCVHPLRGMFAFALWDEKSRTLLLARDRLGKKPLYYSFLSGRALVFGSELEAVRIRLRSDVPVGAFLSGGVDSSAVVATMARLLERPVVTTSIGFEEDGYSELPYAAMVARHIGSEHHERVVRAPSPELIERLVWHLDEPFADSSAVPTYFVSMAAREHVTVALSGDGGDELLAGYGRHR